MRRSSPATARTGRYLLPAKLGPGSYRLDVIATDGAGNRTAVSVRFTVGA